MFKKKQKMKKVLSLIMTLALIVFDLSGVIGGQTVKADTIAVISEGFDAGIVAPADWTFSGVATYAADFGVKTPSIALKVGGNQVITPMFNLTGKATLSFWIKGQASNNVCTSKLLVEQSDGTTWSTVEDIQLTATTKGIQTYTLDTNIKQVRFTFNKVAGNVALDDVKIEQDTSATPNVTVTSVELEPNTLALNVGKTAPIVAKIAPLEATNKNVTWSSDNPAVATVANGVVTAVAEGTANITVTTEDQAKTSLCVVTVTANAPPANKTFDIIDITDFHGQLLDSTNTKPVGAALAKVVKDLKAANPDRTLIIGGGDLYQGTPTSNVLRGVPVQKVLSNMGMEVTALGNHEFDWGLDVINNETMKDANYEIVCANMYKKGTDQRTYKPYKVFTKDGVRIAVIGAILQEAPSIIMPAFVDAYDFKDVATEVNKTAKEIKDGNLADIVLASIHDGGESLNTTVNKLQGVDAVFGGHTHAAADLVNKDADGKEVPTLIANSTGKGYINLKITVDAVTKALSFSAKGENYKALVTTKDSPTDPECKKIVDDASASLLPIFNEKIGTNATILTKDQADSPYGESQLGNWMADVVRNYAKADVSMVNNGGIRLSPIPAGDITVGTIFNIMPFDNTVCTTTMTGAQLKFIFEQAVQDNGKGIQISGVKFIYDSAKQSYKAAVVAADGTITTPEVQGKRVLSIVRESDGTVVNDTDTLKVAAPDFVATGGDGFTGFLNPAIKASLVDSHVTVRDALNADVRAKGQMAVTMNNRIDNQKSATISVVATSDVHGNVLNFDYGTNAAPSKGQGLAKVSTYVKDLRAVNPNVMLIDNGDTIQGTPLAYYYNMVDKTTVYPMSAVMGEMGYDAWTLGNHEFNYGLDTLNRIMTDAKAKKIHMLSANTYKADGTNFVEPYTIKSVVANGKTIKVAILGLTTKTVPSWEDPSHYEGLHFNDLVDEAKKWVPIVKAEGADVVIVSAHSGIEGVADVIPENQIKALATSVNGIDAIVSGHVHNTVSDVTFKNPEGKDVPIVEPGKWAQNISQIDIAVDYVGNVTGLTTKNVSMGSIAEDPAIVTLIAPYQAKTLEYTSTVLGQATGEYSGAKQITEPTEIMELINKVQMSAAGTQLSIAAPLSLKAYIPSGDITIKDIMGVYIYENFMYGVKMNGKQLKDWMEYTVRYYKQVSSPLDPITKDPALNIADYNLDQLYGATYDIDLTQPAGTIDPVTKKMATGNRIKNLKFNGKLVKDSDVFTVAINNYRYNGGGGFMAAAGISNTDASLVTYDSAKALGDDGQVRSLMMKYVQDNKTITPSTSNNWKISTSLVQQQVDVTGVSLNRTSATMKIAGTLNLIATVSPENATSKNVRFTSSNPKVATVSGTGLVKAVNGGKATITATTIDGGFIATCDITVIVPVTGVKLNKTSATIKNTDTLKLIATIMPVNATNKAVSFTSSNPAVATVSANGIVKAVTAGKTTITVTTADGKFTATCKVTVIVPVTGISLQKTYLSIKPKMSETLKVTLLPSNATNKKLIWKSSNVLVATVDGKGKVTAHKTGLAKISVTTVDGNFKAECIVAVSKTLATQVKINKSALTVKVGKEANLLTLLGARNVDSKYVTWTCDSSLIKVIVKNGKLISVSGKAVGNAKITVTSLDGKYITVYKVNIIK